MFCDSLLENDLLTLEPDNGRFDLRRLEQHLVSTVGQSYDDIDRGFVRQLMDTRQTASAPFSTIRKTIYRIKARDLVLGFTVLTEKVYGAIKTGPTVLFPEYHGISLGRGVRSIIEQHARKMGARRLFCTCPVTRPQVVRYLVESGFVIEARLRRHLSESRDEYVLSRSIGTSKSRRVRKRPLAETSPPIRLVHVTPTHALSNRSIDFVMNNLEHIYFRPHTAMRSSIVRALKTPKRPAAVRAKPKRLFVGVTDEGEIRGAALVTFKRSRMAKLNVISPRDESELVIRIVNKVVSTYGGVRRFYVTLPTWNLRCISSLLEIGFVVEGILAEPFQAGVNHVCLGLLREDLTCVGKTKRAKGPMK